MRVITLYKYDNSFLRKIKTSGGHEQIAKMLRNIEKGQLNGLLELHASGNSVSIDARALTLKGMLVVVNAFTAFNNYYGYNAVKLLRIISLEDDIKYWAEFRVLKYEEIIAELEEMDASAVLEGPLRPVELIL